MATDNTPDNKINNYKGNSYSENYKNKNRETFENEARKRPGESLSPVKNTESSNDNFRIKKLKVNKQEVLDDVERLVVSRKAKRIEKIIVALIYIAVFLVAVYFILASFFPGYLPFSKNIYEIKASDSKLFNNLNSFYIDDTSVLGEKTTIKTMITRPITSSKKFNFVFSPKENIPAGQKLKFDAVFVLNQSNPTEIYVDDNLVFPNLKNYELLKETSTDFIYVNKDIRHYFDENSFVSSSTTEDFIYKNMPSASVWSARQLRPVKMDVIDYQPDWTLIEGTFRGDLKLAVYAEDSIDMDFIKQDLNMYLGQDEYVVNIADASGNIIYSNLFSDDGDKVKSGVIGAEKELNVYIGDIEKGIYYITFVGDKYNDAADSTVKDIYINSNKVLISGNFLPWDSFEFYSESDLNKKIGFYYWWGGKEQTINITGTKEYNINLSTDWLSKRYDENFSKGEYYINLEKGYLWVYNDVTSISKDNWFNIPSIQQSKFDNPNLIVIDKFRFDKNIGIFAYDKDVYVTKMPAKVSLRVMEKNSVSLKNARMTVK